MSEKPWPEYVISYQFDGSQYSITIIARDEKEASRRLRAIGMTGQVDGELVMTVPAFPGTGLWLRPLVFLRNLFFGGRP